MRIEDNFALNEVMFNNKFKNIGSSENKEEKSDSIGFGDVLKKCIDDTNDKIVKSDSAATSFIKGEDVNIDEVMIKNQEASLNLQFLTQTRDKLLEGYNQLSRLQL
ncbi:MAG: flagellar hook-basal body complex protein FliE [Clostridium sp.]|uniref:flagellar hook-basal body complex protein FliE n=1 Tax=Clostridium sp. TaxID=1506 RepID=UPI0025BC5E9F|nr:flagellar hook-basal body complex protein FliE [Clostridium sp.]MCE5220757.1 flagellar hook-basal body complex protein FliE [Clostridium sp.]